MFNAASQCVTTCVTYQRKFNAASQRIPDRMAH